LKKGLSIAELILGIAVTVSGAAIIVLSSIQMRMSKYF
jgi:hypothetical protein